MKKFVAPVLVCLSLIGSVYSAEKEKKVEDTIQKQPSEWIWLVASDQPPKVDTKTESTNRFVGWLRFNKRAYQVLAIRLNKKQEIEEIIWNICAYADESMVRQLSRLSSLQSAKILASKVSLPNVALERIRKANPKVAYSRKLNAGDLPILIIEQGGGGERDK